MKFLKYIFFLSLFAVLATGLASAQNGHGRGHGHHGRGPNPGHGVGENRFDLSDSCWNVFLSEIPADTARMLTSDLDSLKKIKSQIDSLRKLLRDARHNNDTALARTLWGEIGDLIRQAQADKKQLDSIIVKYHAILDSVRKNCDGDNDKHHHRGNTVGLRVTPIAPNPARNDAHFTYIINADEHVQITISDQVGTIVQTVFDGQATAGEHHVDLNLSGLQNGMYLVRIQAGADVNTLKLMIGK